MRVGNRKEEYRLHPKQFASQLDEWACHLLIQERKVKCISPGIDINLDMPNIIQMETLCRLMISQ